MFVHGFHPLLLYCTYLIILSPAIVIH